jgi:hypothetical protein
MREIKNAGHEDSRIILITKSIATPAALAFLLFRAAGT